MDENINENMENVVPKLTDAEEATVDLSSGEVVTEDNDSEKNSLEENNSGENSTEESSPEDGGKEERSKVNMDSPKGKKKRPKKDKFAFDKDIRYLGPLSYRHFKILGWLCIVIAQIGVIEGLKLKTIKTGSEFLTNSFFMEQISSLALPFLLISVFAFILKKRDNYLNTIVVYGALSLAIGGIFVFVYLRYILGLSQSLFKKDMLGAADALREFLFTETNFKGYISFNVFTDLFICTLIMFFLEYTPKKYFQGKKIAIFRLLVILPILYEVVCVGLKIAASDRLIQLPLWVSPFLTTKPPVSILMFLSIVRYIKKHKKKFLETGRTEDDYKEYEKTNIHSFRFSRHFILVVLIYALLDLVLLFVLCGIHWMITNAGASEMTSESALDAFYTVYGWGFGGTVNMIDLIPFLLLFSYSRSHKSNLIDTVIPIVGVAAIILIYLDGGFQIIQNSIGDIVNVLSNSLGTVG